MEEEDDGSVNAKFTGWLWRRFREEAQRTGMRPLKLRKSGLSPAYQIFPAPSNLLFFCESKSGPSSSS
ncbi:hypothetical protein SLEP1_g17190 [Rubroshorea leprosula]|uniref:Uncharacterized protein n=1 Tax=Rubroshorea leprosula TaxID=152421 RepID=A0AAV5J114_9ROSI|nr:hypothetical protein SLEP1_g17190 [Rubroshorea leprosula]